MTLERPVKLFAESKLKFNCLKLATVALCNSFSAIKRPAGGVIRNNCICPSVARSRGLISPERKVEKTLHSVKMYFVARVNLTILARKAIVQVTRVDWIVEWTPHCFTTVIFATAVRCCSIIILHSLICRVLLLLLLLLLLRNALRNCTSYFGACMWVCYCRPPIGAHFHPTPNPHPFPSNCGKTLKIGPWIGNFQPKWWNMKLQVYQKVLNQSRWKFNTMLGT